MAVRRGDVAGAAQIFHPGRLLPRINFALTRAYVCSPRILRWQTGHHSYVSHLLLDEQQLLAPGGHTPFAPSCVGGTTGVTRPDTSFLVTIQDKRSGCVHRYLEHGITGEEAADRALARVAGSQLVGVIRVQQDDDR